MRECVGVCVPSYTWRASVGEFVCAYSCSFPRACVHTCACACVQICTWTCVREWVFACVRVCVCA